MVLIGQPFLFALLGCLVPPFEEAALWFDIEMAPP
jgi:hypothetical protein